MLYVCVSFDYELFMGENRVSEAEVLLNPTRKLSAMLRQLGVSATFFADVCCPMAYRRLGKSDFADAFDSQLQDLAKDGHDVQLHIHPHWNATTQVGAQVVFPRESFRIHNWATEDQGMDPVKEMIHKGVSYLKDILTPGFPDYRCLAFRSGGYCLQPEKELVEYLYNEGIRIDSSVCQGMSYQGDGMFYDYRTDPKENNVYISREYGLADNMKQPVQGGLLEVPVAGYATFPFRLIAGRKNRSMGSADSNGYGMKLTARKTVQSQSFMQRLKRTMTATNMLTFDFYSADAMIYMLKRIEKENKGKDVFLSAIAHPKAQTDVHIENMKTVIQSLQKTGKIKFVSMREIADQLQL